MGKRGESSAVPKKRAENSRLCRKGSWAKRRTQHTQRDT